MAKRLNVDCETACMITVEFDSFLSRGSEWGYLDNSKQLIFWLCISKFYAEGNKNASKKGNVILFSISTSFRPLSDDSRSFRNTSEDFQRLPKMSGDYRSFPRRNPKYNASSLSLRNSLRCFLTVATLDCFERSKVTLLLCLSKAESSALI